MTFTDFVVITNLKNKITSQTSKKEILDLIKLDVKKKQEG